VTFNGGAGGGTYSVGNGIDVANLGAGTDTATVTLLTSLQASDTLNGGLDADTLSFTDTTGGTISATLANVSGFETFSVTTGGAGNYVFNLTDAIVTANRATATGNFSVSRAAGDTGTLRVNGGDLTAGTNLALTGSTGADTLTGGAGNDTIVGGGGADSLTGGAGSDRFTVGDNTLALGEVISGGDGTDRIDLTGTNSLAGVTLSSIETLSFAANAALNAQGAQINAQAYTLISADGTARLNIDAVGLQTINLASLGTDSFTGATNTTLGATNDVFIGSGGIDIVVGGDGNDTVSAGSGADTITGGTGADDITGGAGADVIIMAAGASVARTAETLTAGNLANGETITFGNGVDIIRGFVSGTDKLDVATANAVTTLAAGSNATNLAANGNFAIRGDFNATTGVFTVAAAGADTLVLTNAANADIDAAGQTGFVVLIGTTAVANGDFI
jgi:Ca2+-binding RTX toxin-like protein